MPRKILALGIKKKDNTKAPPVVPTIQVPAIRKRTPHHTKTPVPVKIKPGPLSLITPEKKEEICGYLMIGAYTKTAVVGAGILLDTHYHLMNRDPGYALMIRTARAQAELQMVGKIVQADKGASGAQWLLSRTKPRDYGQRQYLVVDRGRLTELSDGELEKLAVLARHVLQDDGEGQGEVIDITPDPGETES